MIVQEAGITPASLLYNAHIPFWNRLRDLAVAYHPDGFWGLQPFTLTCGTHRIFQIPPYCENIWPEIRKSLP